MKRFIGLMLAACLAVAAGAADSVSKQTQFEGGEGGGGTTVGVNVSTQDLAVADDATISDDLSVLGDLGVSGTLSLVTLDVNGNGQIDSDGDVFFESGVFNGTVSVGAGITCAFIQPKAIDLRRDAQTDDGAWTVDVTNNAMFFTGTITQATTIAAPDATTDNKLILFRIKQDATGGRTVTWNAIYRFNGFTGTASTAANAVDHWVFVYNTTDSKWDCIAASKPNLDLSGNLVVAGTGTITGNTAVAGSITAGGGYGSTGVTLSATGDASGDGNATFTDIAATDDLTVADDATITGDLTATNSFTSTGAATLNSTLAVAGALTQTGAATFLSTIDATGIHNVGGTGSNGAVASGTKGSLSVTGVTNVDSATLNRMNWTRVGEVVTVGFSVTVNCTAAASTATEVTVDIPASANFTNAGDLNGDGSAVVSGAYYDCYIDADTTNDKLRLRFNSPTTGDITFSCHAIYTQI